MANVTWTDLVGGPVSLSPNVGGITAASRFNGWLSFPALFGPMHYRLGSGAPMREVHRVEYRASFVIPRVSPTDLVLAQRLVEHLERGGSITVNTTDVAARSYTCTLCDGGQASISGPDPLELWYEVALTVRSTGATRMECVYRSGP